MARFMVAEMIRSAAACLELAASTLDEPLLWPPLHEKDKRKLRHLLERARALLAEAQALEHR